MLCLLAGRAVRTPQLTPAWARSASGRHAAACVAIDCLRSLTTDSSPKVPHRLGAATGVEEFYRYHLNFTIHRDRLLLQPWISKLAPTEQNPHDALSVLNDSQSTLDDVARALEVFVYFHQKRGPKPLAEIKASFASAKPGQRALLWLLGSKAVSSFAYLKHATLVRLTTHCLVAEQGLEYLKDWILMKDNPLAPTVAANVPRIGARNDFWRVSLLLGTMEAQAYWTENPLLLEDSFETFNTIMHKAADWRIYIGLKAPARWITSIHMADRPSLSTTSFEAFLRTVNFWQRDKGNADVRRACLLLRHPRGPKPDTLLKILKRHEQVEINPSIQSLLHPEFEAGSRHTFFVLVELSQALARQGAIDDAKWVLDLGRRHCPTLFAGRKLPKYPESRRLANNFEIAAGLADRDGKFHADLSRPSEVLPGYKPVFARRSHVGK